MKNLHFYPRYPGKLGFFNRSYLNLSLNEDYKNESKQLFLDIFDNKLFRNQIRFTWLQTLYCTVMQQLIPGFDADSQIFGRHGYGSMSCLPFILYSCFLSKSVRLYFLKLQLICSADGFKLLYYAL